MKKTYIFSPSELSYICYHCAYMKHNHNLEDRGISAGITGELDSIQKKYFLGDAKKIDNSIPEGEVIDPDFKNESFISKELLDNKKRRFRIRGKGDALIKFKDKTSGIIDYKTSKFKNKDGSDYSLDLMLKVKEYDPQLHAYSLMYSNLEKDEATLREHDKGTKMGWKTSTIDTRIKERLEKIKEIEVNKTSLMGLVFVYPEEMVEGNRLNVAFSYLFQQVDYKPEKFMDLITKYIDNLEQKAVPAVPEKCKDTTKQQHCYMHSFFFDEKKLEGIKN